MAEDRDKYCIGINVFVLRDGKLLLGKRKNCAGEGEWGLPGGHLELGESMKGAGLRELLEETGLQAESLCFSNIVNDTGNNRHYVQIGFVASNVSGEVKLMEPDRCECWQWHNLNGLPEPIFYGHAKQIELFCSNEKFRDS